MQYFIKQRVFSFKDKFDVMNEAQEPIFKVEGKMFSIKNRLELLSLNEEVQFYAEKKLFRLFPEYNIFSPDGRLLASVKKKFSFRPKFEVIEGNNEIVVDGNFIAHSFTISKNGSVAASIVKKMFSFGDSYMIDVLDNDNLALYLFLTIIIDQVSHENDNKRNGINL